MDKYEQLVKLLADRAEDWKKFSDGDNKAAGRRVRKALMEVKKLSHELRQDITAKKD